MHLQRFNLKDTSSWRELDASWREALVWLHDDYFFGRQDALWRSHALKTLPVLQAATDMLVCGEDLGMIPACVPPVMAQLGLVGEWSASLRCLPCCHASGLLHCHAAVMADKCVASHC